VIDEALARRAPDRRILLSRPDPARLDACFGELVVLAKLVAEARR
jgi:hypothetical protein